MKFEHSNRLIPSFYELTSKCKHNFHFYFLKPVSFSPLLPCTYTSTTTVQSIISTQLDELYIPQCGNWIMLYASCNQRRGSKSGKDDMREEQVGGNFKLAKKSSYNFQISLNCISQVIGEYKQRSRFRFFLRWYFSIRDFSKSHVLFNEFWKSKCVMWKRGHWKVPSMDRDVPHSIAQVM